MVLYEQTALSRYVEIKHVLAMGFRRLAIHSTVDPCSKQHSRARSAVASSHASLSSSPNSRQLQPRHATLSTSWSHTNFDNFDSSTESYVQV